MKVSTCKYAWFDRKIGAGSGGKQVGWNRLLSRMGKKAMEKYGIGSGSGNRSPDWDV